MTTTHPSHELQAQELAQEGLAQGLAKTLQDAHEHPWKHGFLPLMRLLSASRPDLPKVGHAQRPSQENFRIGQQASLSFAAREVAKVEPAQEARDQSGQRRTQITLLGLGMLGPNGAVPLHVTEIVRERVQAKRDNTLANFLDLFHHRALTHFYRAWGQSQSAIGLDREQDETFTAYVARLVGDEPSEVQGSALPPHARWANASHRVRAARNPDGLVASLSHFFGVPVDLQEYQMQWMPLEPQDECRLGVPRLSSLLGQGAIAGGVVPDRQNRFRLVIGPLSLDGYLRLTPQGSATGKDLPTLIELVRSFIGFEFVWEVELLIDTAAAPATQLGGDTRLGWSSWMGGAAAAQTPTTGHTSAKPATVISGMIFEPEAYAKKHAKKPARTSSASYPITS